METINIIVGNEIDPDNYTCIDGTKEENIICAFMALVANHAFAINAEQFMIVYIKTVQMIYEGLRIDFGVYPDLEGKKICADVAKLKEKESKLLGRSSVIKIATFLSGNNQAFINQVNLQFTIFESKLLLSYFIPVGSVTLVEVQ